MNSRYDLARWLISHTRRVLAPLGISAVARIIWQIIESAILVIAATTIGTLILGEDVSLIPLLGGLITLALLKAFFRYVEQYAGHYVAFRALLSLRILLFDRLAPQAPAATQGKASGELTERATRDIDKIEVFFAHTPAPAVSAVAVPTIVLTWLALSVDPLLAGIIALTALASALIPVLAGALTWRAANTMAYRRGAVSTHISDDLRGTREIVGFAAQAQRLDGLDAEGHALNTAASRSGAIKSLRTGAVYAVQALGLIALTMLGARTQSEIGSLISALAVAVSLWKPVRGIDDFTSGLDAAFAAAARVRAIVDAPVLVNSPEVPTALTGETTIELKAVTFSYPSSTTPALSDVTVNIAENAWTCIVGVSGSGKSTIGALILRGWDPDEGKVLLGGVDVRHLDLDELRSAVGVVPQQPVLISGTIADNLRLAAPDASDEELLRALHLACLEDWLPTRSEKLNGRVTAGSGDISGGELQRLALARALVAHPRVLILDEALSQLDADTARNVRQRLMGLGITILEITHRADLIDPTTAVIVLDKGILLETGSAGVLRERGGAFTRVEARA